MVASALALATFAPVSALAVSTRPSSHVPARLEIGPNNACNIYFPSCDIQMPKAPVAAPTIVETNAVCCVVAEAPSPINQSHTFHAINVNTSIINRGMILYSTSVLLICLFSATDYLINGSAATNAPDAILVQNADTNAGAFSHQPAPSFGLLAARRGLEPDAATCYSTSVQPPQRSHNRQLRFLA